MKPKFMIKPEFATCLKNKRIKNPENTALWLYFL